MTKYLGINNHYNYDESLFKLSNTNPASLARARTLTHPDNWRALGKDASGFWGECQGNNNQWYQVHWLRASAAPGCTCSSRIQPCKHALAIVLMAKYTPELFPSKLPPDWLSSPGNTTTKSKNTEKTDERSLARRKNFQKRLSGMMAGLEDLENWLLDLMSGGIAELEKHPYSYWNDFAARMYDAKMGGVGKRIQQIPTLIRQEENWSSTVLEELGTFYLLIRGLRQMDALPLEMQQDLLTFAGVSIRKDTVLAEPSVEDVWMVLGVVEGVEDRLNFRRVWLLGFKTRRYGMILDYTFGNNTFSEYYQAGQVFEGEVAFYPSSAPLRVLVKDKKMLPNRVKRITGFETLNDFLSFYAKTISLNPWQFFQPFSLENVQLTMKDGKVQLSDHNNHLLPTILSEAQQWKILASSGGSPVQIFGEWRNNSLFPLSVSAEKVFLSLV